MIRLTPENLYAIGPGPHTIEEVIGPDRLNRATAAMRETSRRMRSKSAVSIDRLAEVLATFEALGINGVQKLGPYSRSYAYKLVSQAKREVGT